uniref:Uncharacterized protein n=1 Tax=viral metagenome TaxID=1070528 RepID=A0A6C0H8E2_9ZZZZ
MYRINNITTSAPLFYSDIKYLNVNKNMELRNSLTDFYHNKVIKWLNDKKIKTHNNIELIESSKGHKLIYKLLRLYVKKHKINWFDLKNYHYLIKNYLLRKV